MIKKFFNLLFIGMTLTVTTVGAQTFTCDPGWTLQGQTCTKPGIPKTETYVPTCNNGGNLQGGMCVKVTIGPEQRIPAKAIQPAPQPRPPVVAPQPQPQPPVRFRCPSSEWTLNGSSCTKRATTTSYTASQQCPAGPVVNGAFCETYNMQTRKIVRTNAAPACPRGGTLSNKMCVITSPAQTIQATRY